MEEFHDKVFLATLFKVNQRLEISINDKHGKMKSYKSRVEEVHSDTLVVAMPMSHGTAVSLRSGEYILSRLIAGQHTYQFSSYFISRNLSPLPVWVISRPDRVTKVQQRSFVRLGLVIPAQLIIKSRDGSEPERVEVLTRDISGGGAEVVMGKKILHGTQVQVVMTLPEMGAFTAAGEVVRVAKPQEEREVFWVGIRFVDIQERDRDTIIKFIFKKELELRRKENRN